MLSIISKNKGEIELCFQMEGQMDGCMHGLKDGWTDCSPEHRTDFICLI